MESHSKMADEPSRKQLRALHGTSRLLRHHAAKYIFENVKLVLVPQALIKDSKILAQPHIGCFIKKIALWLDNCLPSANISERSDGGDNLLCGKFKWTAEMSIFLDRILTAASRSLKNLKLDLEDTNFEEGYGLNSALTAICSTVDFCNLRKLKLKADDIGNCERWWNANKTIKFSGLQNIFQRLEKISLSQVEWSRCQDPLTVRAIEAWVSDMPLKAMSLSVFYDPQNLELELNAKSMITSEALLVLELQECGFTDSLSKSLGGLKSLKVLWLDRCSLRHEVDRWKTVFQICSCSF